MENRDLYPKLNKCEGCTMAFLGHLGTECDQLFFQPSDDFQRLDQSSKLRFFSELQP